MNLKVQFTTVLELSSSSLIKIKLLALLNLRRVACLSEYWFIFNQTEIKMERPKGPNICMNMIFSHNRPNRSNCVVNWVTTNWTTILTFWVAWTVPGELTQSTFCVKSKTYHDFIVRTLNKHRTLHISSLNLDASF